MEDHNLVRGVVVLVAIIVAVLLLVVLQSQLVHYEVWDSDPNQHGPDIYTGDPPIG